MKVGSPISTPTTAAIAPPTSIPSHGLIPLRGSAPPGVPRLSVGPVVDMAVAGPMARSVEDIALLLAALVAFGGPSAQQEAEDVADDAATAQMQAAIDARCHSRAVHEQPACAVDALAEMQPDRWTPEDAARAALAVPFATTDTKE